MKNVLVTGCSTGIGLATAVHFARNGYKSWATMRDTAKAGALEEIRDAEKLSIEIRALDVTDQKSVDGVTQEVLRTDGALGVLVNNAGVGGATPLEETTEEEHRVMFETNYFGILKMIKAVLPHMRERGEGALVTVSSVTGRVAFPNQIPYSASKWAAECLSEALAHEVARFGIRVAIIEPGVVDTAIFDNSAAATRFSKDSAYYQIMRRNGKFYGAGRAHPEKPENVAAVILDAVTTDNPKLRYPVGIDGNGFIAGRAKISDEEWVAMGGELTDEEYNDKVRAYFGIELR